MVYMEESLYFLRVAKRSHESCLSSSDMDKAAYLAALAIAEDMFVVCKELLHGLDSGRTINSYSAAKELSLAIEGSRNLCEALSNNWILYEGVQSLERACFLVDSFIMKLCQHPNSVWISASCTTGTYH